MDRSTIKEAVGRVSAAMTANRDYLVELDQRCGDGDLGITMSGGFQALCAYLDTAEETDLGRLLMGMSRCFNEAAPSSLGTILSFGMMGMAKALRGRESAGLPETAEAFRCGVEKIMERAGSRPGEKTILDALVPGTDALCAAAAAGKETGTALRAAAMAAAAGAERTREMIPQHGRAAYYGDKNLGSLDGGAEVGRLMFQALAG